MSDVIKICTLCKKKPVDAKFKPFCSKRCADVDLNRWLSDGYVIPGRDGSAAANDLLDGAGMEDMGIQPDSGDDFPG